MLLLGYLFFFGKELSAVFGQSVSDKGCYNSNNNGSTYRGTVAVTETKRPCLNWKVVNSSYVTYYEDTNFCRNPNHFRKPWCYTNADKFAYDYCNIPVCDKDCYNRNNNGSTYRGTVAVTETKRPCLNWKDVNSSYVTYYEDTNFCRNPNHFRKPWCYTNADKFAYDYCNIPVCVVYCPDLHLSNHMILPTMLKGYHYPESVDFQCENGYQANGANRLNCLSSGSWSHQQPTCQAVSCPDLLFISYMKMPSKLTGYHYPEFLDFQCEIGYQVNGANRIKCLSSGMWDHQPPTCQAVSCPDLHSSSYMKIPTKLTGYHYPESVNFQCEIGYQVNGSNQTECFSSGMWSHQPPTCQGVKCPQFKNISNIQQTILLTEYRFPENASFQCNTGYKIEGERHLSCLENGTWDKEQPTCAALQCLPPTLPMHASKTAKESPYYYGDSIHFGCEHGYNLNGSGTLKCIVNGSLQKAVWSYESQTCEGVLCHPPNFTDNTLVWLPNKTEYRYIDNITFDCVGELELSNPLAIKIDCIVDETDKTKGKWKGEIPLCQAKRTTEKANVIGPAVGGGSGAAVIIIIVVVIIFFIRRRYTSTKNKDELRLKEPTLELENSRIYSQVQEREATKPELPVLEIHSSNVYNNDEKDGIRSSGYYAFSVGSQLPNGAIEVGKFYEYVEMGRGKDGDIEQEFLKLKSGLQKPTDAALQHGNKLKNKYKDMYAYDETRVILDKMEESHNMDYINASFIQGYGQVRKYIAAQGPLDKTVNDFWSMIWQYDCGKIVMLTNVFENGKQKCIQYWPDHEQQKTLFRSISLLLVKEEVYSDFTIRRLSLQKGNETKSVIQFHFTAWPDKDVPKYASSLIHFRYKVNTTRTLAKGPLVVHCSAGVGRTGTYIALDNIVNEAKERDYVEVFRSVEILRNQRVNMVQTAHQYLFLHEAVLEALMCPNSGIACSDFPDYYKEMMQFDNSRKKTKLESEFEIMNGLSSRHDEEAFIKGKTEENREKNRYSNIIPVGSEMPYLSTAVEGRNEYINAVFLPGYRDNKTFIVTQMPLETTVVDMWRLVYDYDIPTVVMLNQDTQKESSNLYWPEGDESVTFGPFNITRIYTITKDLYTCLDLTYTYSNKESRQVKLFKTKFWEDNVIVPESANDMLSFLSVTEDYNNHNNGRGPVLVHCLNGCDKSGLYCVLATVIERLRIEQDVDIQHIIKQMRNRRPQIIPNYEQFQFVYKAVIEYLKEFETYSNFQ